MHNEYAVSDLALATSLSCSGFNIERLQRVNPKRIEFCFRYDAGIEETAQAFWSGDLKLPALELFTHYKLLKQRIFAVQNG